MADTKTVATPLTQGAMVTLQREARFLRELLLSSGAVPRESIVMQAALDAVTVVLQRAELAICRNKIKKGDLISDIVSEESHAASAIMRGIDDELSTLDSILSGVYTAARGKRSTLLHGDADRSSGAPPTTALSAAQTAGRPTSPSESFPETQRDDGAAVIATPMPAPEEANATASEPAPNSALKAEATGSFVQQQQEANTAPAVPDSPMVGEASDFPPPPLWYIDGRHRRVPPGWNFPKCNSRDLWIRYWLPCNNGPAIKHLDAVDVSHLKRGGRTLADIKSLILVIKNECIRKGIWTDDPKSEEEVLKLFEDCREYLEGLTEPVTADGDETTKRKRKSQSQYSWQTDIKRARESIKKARTLDEE